ncbi:UNVERIFIED_CONTAM: hypothetical protein Scaly_0070200 [Sesamum calycinum]|uniref:MULE transposase domain-containing protein n=1 Tax=Sesamum calycinum TaxID=2727403 RepID=A0AAW2SUU2_9LAMI
MVRPSGLGQNIESRRESKFFGFAWYLGHREEEKNNFAKSTKECLTWNQRSVFDDSSYADYTQPQWTDEKDTDDEPESSQNSLVYEDIEASCDEDIFLEKNLSKRQMMTKLRKMLNQKSKKKNISHDAGAKDCVAKDNGWYSDPDEEDELQSLDGNDLQVKYLDSRMEKVIRDNPHVPIHTLKYTILRKCNIDASKWKVIRAKRVKKPASKLLLRRKESSDAPMFESMYLSLHAMKVGYLDGCRPIIGLDGCFLKFVYTSQLLVTVERDGNDNMWSIALAMVPVENRKMWTWFLTKLLEDFGGTEQSYRWTFISDRQKGFLDVVKQLAPHSEHRGGKGTHQGPRNDALLGNKVGKNKKATTCPRKQIQQSQIQGKQMQQS